MKKNKPRQFRFAEDVDEALNKLAKGSTLTAVLERLVRLAAVSPTLAFDAWLMRYVRDMGQLNEREYSIANSAFIAAHPGTGPISTAFEWNNNSMLTPEEDAAWREENGNLTEAGLQALNSIAREMGITADQVLEGVFEEVASRTNKKDLARELDGTPRVRVTVGAGEVIQPAESPTLPAAELASSNFSDLPGEVIQPPSSVIVRRGADIEQVTIFKSCRCPTPRSETMPNGEVICAICGCAFPASLWGDINKIMPPDNDYQEREDFGPNGDATTPGFLVDGEDQTATTEHTLEPDPFAEEPVDFTPQRSRAPKKHKIKPGELCDHGAAKGLCKHQECQ